MNDETIDSYVLMIANVIRESTLSVNMMNGSLNVNDKLRSLIFNILKDMVARAISINDSKVELNDEMVMDYLINRISDSVAKKVK